MSEIRLKAVSQEQPEFETLLTQLSHRGDSDLTRVEGAVREIVNAVRAEKDAAVLRYIERFERRTPDALFSRDYGGAEALAGLEPRIREALELAARRIRRYHEMQREHLGGFEFSEGGVTLASR